MKFLTIFLLLALTVRTSLSQPKVVVDPSQQYQTITGFGAFGGVKAYWETPPFYTDQFLNYFLEDLGSTIVRTNIFWDLEPANDNASPRVTDLAKFRYKAGSNLANQLPYYKALKEAGLKKLIATAWTPPEWMKLHDDPDRTPDQCANCNCPVGDPARSVCGGRLNPVYYEEYAEYLLTYVKILKQEVGVDVYAINIQNEPFFANPFESNVMLPEEYADVLKVVGERFRAEGLTTKLFGPEHMAEWSWTVQQNYVNEILNDPAIRPYLDIYAVHGYVDGVAPDYGSADGWEALHENISEAHDIPLWMTETSGYAQTFDGAMDLVRSMYLALRFGNISAWVYWGISGDPGSSFSIMADGEPTVLYYASKQFYKYIRPGAVRIEASAEDAQVLPLAFQNPESGAMTLILINQGDTEITVDPQLSLRPDEFTIYRTSSSENCENIGTYQSGNIILPLKSITTLVGYGPSGPSLDDIPDYYVKAGDDVTLAIPLTGISDGGGGDIAVEVQSSNTSIVDTPQVDYAYPDEAGKLVITPDTSEPGRTLITVTLTNQNAVDDAAFGFNTTHKTFAVEVVDVVTAVGGEEHQAEDIDVYPNPVRNQLVIDLSASLLCQELEITDGNGKRIFYRQLLDHPARITVSTALWDKGIYFVRLRKSNVVLTKKIIL